MEQYSGLDLQFINGTWREGVSDEAVLQNINPYTGEVLQEIKLAAKSDIDEAYKAAKEAAKKWGATNYTQRREVMEKALAAMLARQQEFVDWLVKESGSTQIKAAIEFGLSVEGFRHAIGVPSRAQGHIYPVSVPGKESRAYRKPLGVIGVISPWNFPFYLGLRSVAVAIALGNTVVLKPAATTPVTGGTFMAKIFEEAGVPAGVINVVIGSNEEIGDAFTTHPVPRLISFTGSTGVGKHIGSLCGQLLKKSVLELGGNNVFIVREDADIDYAVKAALFGKFLHQGQICMSINRILVHDKVYEEFTQKFTEKAKTLIAGDPSRPEVAVGPLIEKRQLDRILKSLDDSVSKGARIVLGGTAEGNVLAPTVVVDATNDMSLACDEIFGPVAVILKFKDDAEAIAIANDTIYGLSGAIHTRDLDRGARMAQEIETGMVHVNDQPVNDEPQTIFGGEKSSGLSRFNGDHIVEEFTTLQLVTIQYEQRPFPWGN